MYLVRAYVRPGDVVIDATCGNGHDTLRLAQMQPGHLYAFDVQPAAIQATQARLLQAGFDPSDPAMPITLLCMGHEKMGPYFRKHPCMSCPAAESPDQAPLNQCSSLQKQSNGFARAIVFNLGYLPGGDKSNTTRTDTTLQAVQDSLDLLMPEGLLCVTMYSGHPEGANEKRALLSYAEGLDRKRWHVTYINMLNQKNAPPEILLITRKS